MRGQVCLQRDAQGNGTPLGPGGRAGTTQGEVYWGGGLEREGDCLALDAVTGSLAQSCWLSLVVHCPSCGGSTFTREGFFSALLPWFVGRAAAPRPPFPRAGDAEIYTKQLDHPVALSRGVGQGQPQTKSLDWGKQAGGSGGWAVEAG